MSSSLVCLQLVLALITLDCPNRRVDARKIHKMCQPVTQFAAGQNVEVVMPEVVNFSRRVTKLWCKPKRKP